MYDVSGLNNLIEESLKMSKFHHPNVMKLIGVCIDMGESIYVVMPYMIHGSLLPYLKKRRAELTIDNVHNTELVSTPARTHLTVCLNPSNDIVLLCAYTNSVYILPTGEHHSTNSTSHVPSNC